MSPKETIMIAALAPIKPSRPPRQKWTDENDKRAAAYHKQGLSAAKAAVLLGTTRNAVIGKWGRMKLPQRRSGGCEVKKQRRPKGQDAGVASGLRAVVRRATHGPELEPRPVPKSVMDPHDIPRQQRKTMETLGPRHCRFPYGDPLSKDFFFCGAVRDAERPYCAAHCRIAYTVPTARRPYHHRKAA